VSSRRTLILVAAVVVGLLSAFLVFNYVNGADQRAQGNAEQVTVLKANAAIKAGTSADAAKESIVEAEIPKKDKSASAINDRSVITGKVAAFDIPANTPLVDGMFVDPVQSTSSNSGRVADDCGTKDKVALQCVAISLQFDKVHAVGGLISPGDRVNILVLPKEGSKEGDLCTIFEDKDTFNALSDAAKQALFQFNPGAPLEWVTCTPAEYLYQSVKVLFVDHTTTGAAVTTSSADTSATAPQVDTGLITFEVPPQAAAILASYAQTNLYLTLLPDNYKAVALPAFDPTMPLLPGQSPTDITPYGPSGFPDN
jgi:Flp pilus assembly protein CpaB